MGIAVQNCADTHQGLMPPALGNYPGTSRTGGARCGTYNYAGMMFYLLPYIEQQNLYNFAICKNGVVIDAEQGVGPAAVGGVMQKAVKTYLCPSDPTVGPNGLGYGNWAAVGSYVYNGMIFQGDWGPYARFPSSITDGTSQTIFFTDCYAGGDYNGDANLWWWSYNTFQSQANLDCGGIFYGPSSTNAPLITPALSYCQNNKMAFDWGGNPSVCMCRATSPHTGGINVGMGDGSTRFVAQGISGQTWFNASTPNKGDILGPDW
jgi:prepilin-type processing-associated H-X9-DG protein